MDRFTGYQPYVFMQDGAQTHTANETVRFLNQQRYLTLLQSNMWLPNSPDLNPVNYCVGAKCLPRKKIWKHHRIESNSSRVGSITPRGNQ